MDMHAKRRPQIIERSYDYKKFDDNYHRELVAIDTLLEEFTRNLRAALAA